MENLYDVIVVGGGPAGLTAALYLARAQYRVLVLERETFGGQITITSDVVNYPGILKTNGRQLGDTLRRQAEQFGAEFMLTEAESIDLNGPVKTVRTPRGELKALGLLVATGASPRRIGFAGESDFQGRGVAYCATCDGEFFTDLDVLVIGGGFAAAEEAVFLTKYARHVTVLVRKDRFACAASVAQRCLEHPRITVRFNTELDAVGGDTALRYAHIRNNQTGEVTAFKPADRDTFGVFVFAGYVPASDLVKGQIEVDANGYIVTDRCQKTSADGVYAAGDICIKPLRQVVTAVADGAMAATELEKYVAGKQRETGLKPERPRQAAHNPSAVAADPLSADPPANETAGGNRIGAHTFMDAAVRDQLQAACARFERGLQLAVYADDRPVSIELAGAMREVAGADSRLHFRYMGPDEAADTVPLSERPMVAVCTEDGRPTGLAFHGVPGGHEFQSFVIGLYNAAGPGQTLDDALKNQILALRPSRIQLLVSLSCTQCPDLVMAAQRIAALHPGITADVYDLNHFPDLKEQYNVMSVPCMVLNEGETVTFGKKTLPQVIEALESAGR